MPRPPLPRRTRLLLVVASAAGVTVAVVAGALGWRSAHAEPSPQEQLALIWADVVRHGESACAAQQAGALPDASGASPLDAPVAEYEAAATEYNEQARMLSLLNVTHPEEYPLNVSVEQDGEGTDWCVVSEALSSPVSVPIPD